jgi:hypothetical protein
MIPNNYKTSIRVPSQLPEFIRDDLNYETFVAFLQAYYEWTELANTANANTTIVSTENQGITTGSKNLLNYADVDETLDGFLQYYINDFLPYFPEDALSDKREILKIAKELYSKKGTPASYKLLFRLLYNSDAEILNTGELILRASDGNWFIPKYLKIKTSDINWLSPLVENLRVFGETSKAFALIDHVETDGLKYNVYISNIERLFQSGEQLRIVDANNQDVYFLNGEIVTPTTPNATSVRAKLVGSISTINVSPTQRGETYKVGDPVVIYGGLNEPDGLGAAAEVGSVTAGSIRRLNLNNGGYGYREDPNTAILFNPSGGAIAHVTTLDPTLNNQLISIPIDSIALKQNIKISDGNYYFANATNHGYSANANTTLQDALTFTSFIGRPISSVIMDNGGGGFSQVPVISAESIYQDDANYNRYLGQLGTLAPVQIRANGTGYSVNTKIIIDGGNGYGAAANIKTVDAFGGILTTEFVPYDIPHQIYPVGGMGYTLGDVNYPGYSSYFPVVAQASSTISTDTLTGNFSMYEYIYQPPNANVQVDAAGLLISTNATFIATLTSYETSTGKIQLYNIIPNSNTNPNYTDIYGNSFETPNVTFLQANSLLTGFSSGATANVTSNTINGTDASLYIDGIAGQGALFTAATDRVGSVTTINVTNHGEDYVTNPYVTLKVQDLVVTNITDITKITNGIVVFQGEDVDAINATHDIDFMTYQAKVDSISLLVKGNTTANSYYRLRVFDYYGSPVLVNPSDVANTVIQIDTEEPQPYPYMTLSSDLDNSYGYKNGVKTYGDGNARVTSKFLNGLIYGDGVRTDAKGLLSSYCVLQNEDYNDFTYQLTVEQPISKYRDIVKNLLQPTGLKMLGRDILKSEKAFNVSSGTNLMVTKPLKYWADWPVGNFRAYATIEADLGSLSTNKVKYFNGSLSSLSTGEKYITINTNRGPINSKIDSIDDANGIMTMTDSIFMIYPNVAYGYANTETGTLKISDFSIANTPNYDIVNDGNYSNTQNHIRDVILIGDTLLISGNNYIVSYIDYNTNVIRILNAQGILTSEANAQILTENSNNIILGEIMVTMGSINNPVPISINRSITTSNVYISTTE